MAVNTIRELSDGEPCKVKRLGIFDLDIMGPALVGPFIYSFKMADGKEVEVVYPLDEITTPPQHPGIPENEIVEGTPAWHSLLEWQTYKMAVAHERNRIQSMIDYVLDGSRGILEKALEEEDWDRVVTDGDWLRIVEAAIVPQITPEILAETFRTHFKAQFDGREIFEAMKLVSPGSGSYDALRVWEINTMTSQGYTEEQWADLTLSERTRKVAAAQLPKLLEALEADLRAKEMAAKARAG